MRSSIVAKREKRKAGERVERERRGKISSHRVGGTVGLLGWVVAIVSLKLAIDQIGAHDYTLTSPSGLGEIEAQLRTSLRIAVPVGLAILIPWWLVERRRAGVRSLAWVWSVLAVGGVWAWRGYLYNRYDAAVHWRTPTTLGGQTIPQALLELEVLGVNVLLTVGAAILIPVVAALLRVGLRSGAWPRVVILERAGWALLVLAIAGSWGVSRSMRPTPDGPDLILISLDAVRADRVGCYGYDRDTTPHLDALATQSLRFDRAYCQEPWTLTSHMSMLSGLYPDAHGLDFGRSLAPSVWTLPERLRDVGYRTMGTVYDCFLLNPQFGYAAGFDRYEVNDTPAMARGQAAADWLLASTRPAFLFLHFYDPHTDTGPIPYESGSEYMDRLAPGSVEAFLGWSGPGGASESLHEFNQGQRPLSADQLHHLSQLYDASLAESDAALGAFLDRLREAGRLENALVVVLSDHGEALGERDHTMHEELMEATLRIPLVVHLPGGERGGEVRRDLVETVDIAPTFLAVAGLAPEAVSQGKSLLTPTGRRLAYHRSGPKYALSTDEGWRLSYTWQADEPRFESIRPYGADPADGANVFPDSMGIVSRHLPDILRWHDGNRAIAGRFAGGDVEISADDEELLRSLGYID